MVNKSLEKTRRKFGKPRVIELDTAKYLTCSYFCQMYESISLGFAICSNVLKRKPIFNKMKLACPITTCRETLAQYVLNMVRGAGNYSILDLPENKTCVLVCANAGIHGLKKLAPPDGKNKYTYEEWMPRVCASGCNLVNHFEKHNGWLRTKHYKVEYNLNTDRYLMYGFIGSKWWLHSPQSFSLFTLLIRMGRYNDIQELRKNPSREEVMKVMKNLSGVKSTIYDRSKISNPAAWMMYLDNYKSIYKDRKTLVSNWNSFINQYSGIQYLLSGQCNDKTITKRFQEIRKGKKRS